MTGFNISKSQTDAFVKYVGIALLVLPPCCGRFNLIHKWLWYRYMQLQLRAVAEAQGAVERRVTALEAASQEPPPAEEASIKEKHFFLRRPHWMNRRVFVSAALTVATVAGSGGHPVLKLLSMFPLLYLIPPDGH